MLLIENLEYLADDFKISIPSWTIKEQGITVLRGVSGAGKTTLLKILIGLEKANAFSWKFHDEEISILDPSQRNFGVVFQSVDLFPHMTVEENIFFAARIKNHSKEKYESKLKNYIEKLHLQSVLKKSVTKISGGEAQRVALARCLMLEPRMLFLDEPFSALDEQTKNETKKLLRETIINEKIPALVISHDPIESDAFSDKIFELKSGQLIEIK